MRYVHIDPVNGKVTDVSNDLVRASMPARQIESRWDWKTMGDACRIACLLGSEYIPTDAGPNVSPRYDVIKLPQVGDKVSYAFNGDSYPCGTIKSISESKKLIVTTEGQKFYRRRNTGSWVYNGTWSLQAGHCYKQNPSF